MRDGIVTALVHIGSNEAGGHGIGTELLIYRYHTYLPKMRPMLSIKPIKAAPTQKQYVEMLM